MSSSIFRDDLNEISSPILGMIGMECQTLLLGETDKENVIYLSFGHLTGGVGWGAGKMSLVGMLYTEFMKCQT